MINADRNDPRWTAGLMADSQQQRQALLEQQNRQRMLEDRAFNEQGRRFDLTRMDNSQERQDALNQSGSFGDRANLLRAILGGGDGSGQSGYGEGAVWQGGRYVGTQQGGQPGGQGYGMVGAGGVQPQRSRFTMGAVNPNENGNLQNFLARLLGGGNGY